jgi:hypothetical protein
MKRLKFCGVLTGIALLACGNNSATPDPGGAAGTPGTAPTSTSPNPIPSGGAAGMPTNPAGGNPAGGSPAGGAESPTRKDEREAIQAALKEVSGMTDKSLAAAHAVPFASARSYDLTQVAGLDLIQKSALKLADPDLARLASTGFAISTTQQMPSFLYGYASIYAQDLPLYVSADSILNSIHESYDEILKQLEKQTLSPDLQELLSGMLSKLKTTSDSVAKAATRADADVYLSVAASLLAGQLTAPNAGGDAQLVAELFDNATKAQGAKKITLFGVEREEDFSQFTPRGHYLGDPVLERYFRTMMWLGRTDFRMLETQSDGQQVFRRNQLEAALLLRELIDAPLRERFARIDDTVTAFVGEHDYMRLAQLDSLLADLGVDSLAALSPVSDDKIVAGIVAKGYGVQRISSHIMYNGLKEAGTLPLSASFALLGQRYVIDSHVFSNVVYDRAGKGAVMRMMPNPLDVAFAALRNDQAVSLLAPELEKYAYAPDLASMRVLSDAHPQSFWQGNLYNLWLSSIRALSPDAQAISNESSGLFPVARTEAWGRRLLSTQLASWAELRHDTILYAKQSYTGGTTCEFPDAYVDPYPEFYAKVGEYAARGKDLVARLHLTGQNTQAIVTYFDNLALVASRLGEMAQHERTGAAFTPEMMNFINEAVTVQSGCGSPFISALGWYGRLFYSPYTALEFDPTIADVHTQPTDEAGNPVGKVLHVGTGRPRALAVIADGCSGPRAYLGLVSSYYEVTTRDYKRLNDVEWAKDVGSSLAPAEPEWMKPLLP